MTIKNTQARKAYWASMTPQQRSERMRAIAVSRQKKMSFKAKRKHALKMVEAKKKGATKKNVV